MISEDVGGILGKDDFKTLYAEVTQGLTEAQLAATNAHITGTGTDTSANVNLLKQWYTTASVSDKVFANNLIISSVTAATKTAPSPAQPETASVSCPVGNYAAFGHLYSDETSGKSWATINRIDSWVRGALPAVGAPLSVRKLRDCYRNVLSHAERKDFSDNAVAHMKAGQPN